MRVDDLKTWLGTNLPAYLVAASLPALAADQIIARVDEANIGAKPVQIMLDAQPEEIEPFSNFAHFVTWPVHFIVFAGRGLAEGAARDRAAAYAAALAKCLAAHPDFRSLDSRDDFDGVEGRLDCKATKIVATFAYEEAIA